MKDFLDSMYSVAAQYDHPPDYPVTLVCKGIDGAPKGTDVIGRIFAGVVSYRGKHNCYDTNTYNHPTQTNVGWGWQVSLSSIFFLSFYCFLIKSFSNRKRNGRIKKIDKALVFYHKFSKNRKWFNNWKNIIINLKKIKGVPGSNPSWNRNA